MIFDALYNFLKLTMILFFCYKTDLTKLLNFEVESMPNYKNFDKNLFDIFTVWVIPPFLSTSTHDERDLLYSQLITYTLFYPSLPKNIVTTTEVKKYMCSRKEVPADRVMSLRGKII